MISAAGQSALNLVRPGRDEWAPVLALFVLGIC